MKEIEKLQPRAFTKFCMSIGAVPSSYLAGLSFEEQLLWFCSYLEKNVIPAVNNNAEAVTELQNLYTELKDYVDNYFDNLDVQEEINNKLDEMAEQGTLQEIIDEYINLKSMLVFDTVADMKAATNVIAGSYVRTYGFTTKGDNGGAIYKIREIINTDVVDEKIKIAITYDNDLIAELSEEKVVTPEMFGALGDGTHDDTTNIQTAISYSNEKRTKILFSNGKTYAVSNITIATPLAVDFNNAVILSNSEDSSTSVINIGLASQTFEEKTLYAGKFNVSNIKVDCNNTDRKYAVEINCRRLRINRIEARNVKNIGVYCGGNDGIWIEQIFVGGDNETATSAGVVIDTNDIILGNVEVAFMRYGVKVLSNQDDIIIDNLHAWSDVANCAALRFDGPNAFNADIHSLVIDSLAWGIDLTNTASLGHIHVGNIKVFPSVTFTDWRLIRKYSGDQTTGITIESIYGISDTDATLRLQDFRGLIYSLSNYNQAPQRYIEFNNINSGTTLMQFNGLNYQMGSLGFTGNGAQELTLGSIGSYGNLLKNVTKFIAVTIMSASNAFVGNGFITWDGNNAVLRTNFTLTNGTNYKLFFNLGLPSGYAYTGS